MNYLGPVEGSPLISPELATIYFIVFLIILAILYAIFHYVRKPYFLEHKIIFLVTTAIALKIFFFVGGSLVLAYWLIPRPNVVSTIPINSISAYPVNQKIEVLFDRPVNRKILEKSITPDVPGVFVFEDSLYSTHLYRKLVFYPTFTLNPNTRYTIILSNIKNLAGISKPFNHTFSFTTQKSPEISQVIPKQQSTDVRIDAAITVTLDSPNEKISELDFELNPPVRFDIVVDDSKTQYSLKPRQPLQQGTEYRLKVRKTDVKWNLNQNKIVLRNQIVDVYDGVFLTKEAPGIAQFTPSGTNVFVDSDIVIEFSHPMISETVEKNLSISPTIPGAITWKNDKTLVFSPSQLAYETAYTVAIKKGAKDKQGGFIEQDVKKMFTTIGHVRVANFYPADTWKAVGINNAITVEFDQEVDKKFAESFFSIKPEVEGSFSWQENTLVFNPARSLAYSTTYTVVIAKDVKSTYGQNSTVSFTTTFTTQDKVTKLNVPVHLQQYTLSCEIAALRMALLYRGVDASEDTLLDLVGYDLTEHKDGVWGDPYVAFVGNVRGTQMVDGYGVYWPPIARAAKTYRNATDFEGWNAKMLAETIAAGNPVVIWTYSKNGYPSKWKTKDGKEIYAVSGEHAVTAVGFIGTTDNPTDFIVNDPLVGQVYWSRSVFESKWSVLNRSGVVVY